MCECIVRAWAYLLHLVHLFWRRAEDGEVHWAARLTNDHSFNLVQALVMHLESAKTKGQCHYQRIVGIVMVLPCGIPVAF